eukprot:3574544-Prymnesium_polylepis.1
MGLVLADDIEDMLVEWIFVATCSPATYSALSLPHKVRGWRNERNEFGVLEFGARILTIPLRSSSRHVVRLVVGERGGSRVT